jgi:Ca-activated chloride channel family protein
MKKATYVMMVLVILSTAFHPVQERTITGKITNASDGSALPGVSVHVKGTLTKTTSDGAGEYRIKVPASGGMLVFSFVGFVSQEFRIGVNDRIDIRMVEDFQNLDEVAVTQHLEGKVPGVDRRDWSRRKGVGAPVHHEQEYRQPWNTEEYDGISENIFHAALRNPLSTFSIDVDAASYSNVRRFIQNGQHPPKDAVRIEELVNYFDYDYEQPTDEHPFRIVTEVSTAPWNQNHKLVHIGLQGREIATGDLPPSNLVFLIDVSGSMNAPNKLPLLKSSFKLLVDQLREQDRVAIVVYAGAAGVVLDATAGSDKRTILHALDNLEAGGSTAGGAGIRLAYDIARENFRTGGNNRVILATDGDFNIGESSNAAMERLIGSKREEGVFLTVLGFGMGNYKDSKMETLADKGNGNYAYIDNLTEARKVLVSEFGGTLFAIAKDVKLQVEFNPAKVKAYRLIGYENRMLKDEDFNNDRKDAGDLGSGHTVTALYEIIPAGVNSEFFTADELKYQKNVIDPAASVSKELMTIKFRYKKPDQDVSKLMVHTLADSHTPLRATSDNFRWSAAVASFGMLLRESEYAGDFTYDRTIVLAEGARGGDPDGYRTEFINMVKSLSLLARK